MELTEEADADVFCHLLAEPDPVLGFARIISGSLFGHFVCFFPFGPQGKVPPLVTLPNLAVWNGPVPIPKSRAYGLFHRTREHGGDLRD